MKNFIILYILIISGSILANERRYYYQEAPYEFKLFNKFLKSQKYKNELGIIINKTYSLRDYLGDKELHEFKYKTYANSRKLDFFLKIVEVWDHVEEKNCLLIRLRSGKSRLQRTKCSRVNLQGFKNFSPDFQEAAKAIADYPKLLDVFRYSKYASLTSLTFQPNNSTFDLIIKFRDNWAGFFYSAEINYYDPGNGVIPGRVVACRMERTTEP